MQTLAVCCCPAPRCSCCCCAMTRKYSSLGEQALHQCGHRSDRCHTGAIVRHPDLGRGLPGHVGETITNILIGVAWWPDHRYCVNVLHARKAVDEANLSDKATPFTQEMMNAWRMPPLDKLKPMVLSQRNRIWMGVLRGYLVVAMGMVIFKVVQLAMA
ncbi:hypothetical protein QNM99_28030 [Pseudomonas sp. PCH446]